MPACAYALDRTVIAPSASRRTTKGSAVVGIGVGRHGDGRKNGTRLAKDDSANVACNGHS
jgi:hypothetical protein